MTSEGNGELASGGELYRKTVILPDLKHVKIVTIMTQLTRQPFYSTKTHLHRNFEQNNSKNVAFLQKEKSRNHAESLASRFLSSEHFPEISKKFNLPFIFELTIWSSS